MQAQKLRQFTRICKLKPLTYFTFIAWIEIDVLDSEMERRLDLFDTILARFCFHL